MRTPIAALALASLLALACGSRQPTEATAASGDAATQAEPLPERAEVVIVGAGLTGLTTAYRLAAAGVDVLVLEASPRAGGRIQTVRWPDGLRGEAHMEEYWERSPAYPLLKELGLELDEDVAHSSVRIDGRIIPYVWPFDDDAEPSREEIREAYLSGLFDDGEKEALLGWMGRTWAIYQRLEQTALRGQPLPDDLLPLSRQSFADWIQDEGLPPRVAEWIRVIVEPEMAIEWDRIAALDGIDEVRLFLDTPDGFGERNFHVHGGNDAFVAALLDRIEPAGRVVTGARVLGVAQDPSGVTVRVLRDDREFHLVRADQVVLTMPVWDVGRVQFEPPLDEKRQRALATTLPASYVKVLIRVAPEACPLTTMDVGGERVPTLVLLSDSPAGSIYEASAGDRPCDGDSREPRLFTLLLHARFARDVMDLPHDAIRARVYAAMDDLYPGISAHFLDAEIFSYPRAVAYWPLGEGRSRFDALAQHLRRPVGRVWIGGDTTENAHSEGAVQAAERMAREILEARGQARTQARPQAWFEAAAAP
jgi:monoamine oxidase